MTSRGRARRFSSIGFAAKSIGSKANSLLHDRTEVLPQEQPLRNAAVIDHWSKWTNGLGIQCGEIASATPLEKRLDLKSLLRHTFREARRSGPFRRSKGGLL